jgi:predicted Zn-ribbon and HTH transcriptional regulator
VAFRKHLMELLSAEPRTVSSLARELGLGRRDVEQDLRHMIRSARAAGHRVTVEPARCRACGYLFGEDKLSKPSRCPACKSTWLFEPLVRVEMQ